MTTKTRPGLLGAAVLLSCALAGCQSQSSPPATAPGGSAPSPTAAAKRIDACAMLSAQDISPLLGVTVAGRSTGQTPGMGGCEWDNPTTDESVSLQIANPGTALNNTLPPPTAGLPEHLKPGPDGMRLLGNGAVDFPAGNRVNTVQVAVLRLLGDQADAAAVDLARKVAPQVPN